MPETKNYIPALKYDWLTRLYDPVLQLTMPERKFKSALIAQMKIRPGSRILDFGCGSLTLSIMAAQAHPQAKFFGVDIDEKILDIARKKQVHARTDIHIQRYDGGRLPYPDACFDFVMSSLVFHHIPLDQKYAVMGEIRRVLKDAGEIHVADFGKPVDILQRAGFYGVQLLDGFKTTRDSVTDRLPGVIRETGFSQVDETGVYKTIVGTVRLIKGAKSTV